ncbi:P-loop containing nucleoside triphosphate hydrolase protein [Kalaharituber pfeilii]|nr:P-loop containing nucleoside triphosphate hydrolase protein [Kalaharituber pfeilii]
MSQPWDYIAVSVVGYCYEAQGNERKVVNIGDSGCGKTSLTIRLCEGRFQPDHNVTIGVEFGSRVIPIPPLPSTTTTDTPEKIPRIKLQIWDTAGQETFRSITRSYFRGCAGAIIVYDVTRRETFRSAGAWLEELMRAAGEGYAGDSGGGVGEGGGVSVILVGNKKDLVDGEDGEDTAEQDTTSSTDTTAPASGLAQLKKKPRREVTEAEARAWAEQHGIKYFVETSAKSGEGVEEAFVAVAREIYERIKDGRVVVGGRTSGVKGPGGKGKGMDQTVRIGGKIGVVGGCC